MVHSQSIDGVYCKIAQRLPRLNNENHWAPLRTSVHKMAQDDQDENPQLDSAVRQIREVGGPEDGWCGRTVARPTAGVGKDAWVAESSIITTRL